jgi:hypothetical protein
MNLAGINPQTESSKGQLNIGLHNSADGILPLTRGGIALLSGVTWFESRSMTGLSFYEHFSAFQGARRTPS